MKLAQKRQTFEAEVDSALLLSSLVTTPIRKMSKIEVEWT